MRLADNEAVLERLAADVAAAVTALGRMRSPRSRLIAATRLLDALRGAERAVAGARDQAIGALAATGSSYAQMGELAGLTRGRVAQIAQDLSPKNTSERTRGVTG